MPCFLPSSRLIAALYFATLAAALLPTAPAHAAPPELDCQSPKAPPGYTHFGIGRASLAQTGSVTAAKAQAHLGAERDLLDRLCTAGCGCNGVQVQHYSFGQRGDEVCHMALVTDDEALRVRRLSDPASAGTAVTAALNAVWSSLRVSGKPTITLAVEGGSAGWLRGQATAWLATRGTVVSAADCATALAATELSVCLRMGPAATGASQRDLQVEARCGGGKCGQASQAAAVGTCALQAATGVLVCPDDGEPAGDHCEARGGAVGPCTRQPIGGAGVWASAEAEGSDEPAAATARAEALRRVIAPIVGVTSASGRDDALEARLRHATIGEFGEFRCRASATRLRVTVFVPTRERERLVRAQRNAVLGLLACTSLPVGACTPDLRDRLRGLANAAGVALSDVVELATEPDGAQLAERTARAGATAALVLRLSARYDRLEMPYHVCRAQVAASDVDAATPRATKEAKPFGAGVDGGFKGVVYAGRNKPVDACGKALLAALLALEPLMASWRP